ncbi:MAG TPA: ice-binding family protein [Candidatus Acidoferrales bacterium]|jgi:hypothetical protein|nr:ice-binding family protein [Candidatus Acidoferrales bacterium]
MKKTSAKRNKTLNVWKLAFGLALAAVLSPHNSVAGETSVVDFTSQTTMEDNDSGPSDAFGMVDPKGQVNVRLISQGNASSETLNISLANLNHNTAYQLIAYLGADTNAMSITNFTTDLKGSFKISYMKASQGKINPPAKLLPDALDPLCNVRELDIVDGSANMVLRAVLTDPSQGSYHVERTMANAGLLRAAAGNLSIQANAQSVRFQLQASHLTPNTSYRLAVNDTIAPPSMSDSTGKLTVKALPPGSPAVLDIQVVTLIDDSANIVLMTEGLGIPCTMAGEPLPTVDSTIPADTATGVAINNNIAATFNEMMDLSTIGNATFTLMQGTTNVAGTVTYSGVTAVFNPANNLKPNTLYTATITTGVRNLTENKLATNFVWSFTTGAQIDPNANSKSINLGAASTFAILAKAGISGGADQINGDVGLDPGSAQGIDPSEINGTIHVNDQAVIDAQAGLLDAYDQVVSLSVNAISLPGNLGGLTLAPGLYVNASSTGISGTGANAILTLNAQGNANAVFIFKMGSTLTTDPGTSIVLSGGAQAKNIFWQVGSSATLGTTSIFKGNIMAAVTITVNNGSVVNGRLFAGSGGDASGAVTVQSSTITVPAP